MAPSIRRLKSFWGMKILVDLETTQKMRPPSKPENEDGVLSFFPTHSHAHANKAPCVYYNDYKTLLS